MNWGNKLLFTFLVFGGGMFYLVYRSMHTNFELVEKDYYKSELRYQQVIDATKKGNDLSSQVNIETTADGILLRLPMEMKNCAVTGDILFYCAYDEKKDRHLKIETDKQGLQIFPKGIVASGTYTVKVSWNCNKELYFSEKQVIIP